MTERINERKNKQKKKRSDGWTDEWIDRKPYFTTVVLMKELQLLFFIRASDKTKILKDTDLILTNLI